MELRDRSPQDRDARPLSDTRAARKEELMLIKRTKIIIAAKVKITAPSLSMFCAWF
jgi:hypothetical protein